MVAQIQAPVNPARAAFRGSQAHIYVQQMALAEKPRHIVVNDDRYLSILETSPKHSVLLETCGPHISITVDYKRSQKFSLAALATPARILDYLGLQDDNGAFSAMCAAFAVAHPAPVPQSEEDRRIDFEQARDRVAQEQAEALANIRKATSAAAIGADIKQMLGQSESPAPAPVSEAERKLRRERAYAAALRPEAGNRRGRGAAMPAAWRER